MPCSIPQSLDEVLTPSRKRKRDSNDNLRPQTCYNGLANEGFTSTPRKGLTSVSLPTRPIQGVGITGINPFVSSGSCMEVKSIAEIANEKSDAENPYEVIRKPPKKKKKADIEEVCFENPALNLDGPEKRFNPFEVKREPLASSNDSCFINSALNIKSPENAAVNPFEITRAIDSVPEGIKEGIENPALEDPTPITIALPFTPTIGCRIDFSGVPLNSLTPSKLFAEKLVFSPPVGVKGSAYKKSFRRSLSVISEEAVDIGKELDCYQLELENSINEAKLKKKNPEMASVTPDKPNDASGLIGDQQICNKSSISINITNVNISLGEKSPASEATPPVVNIPSTIDDTSDADISFDDEIDFKEPAPFVRCYRKPELPRTNSTEIANTSNTSNASKGSNKSDKENDGKHKISDMIRKSIRRIVHPHFDSKKEDKEQKLDEHQQQSAGTNNFMSSIRRSLRRKNHKRESNNNNNPNSESNMDSRSRDISIIDTADKRKVFKFTATGENDRNGGNVITDAKSLSLRKSLRKSTRDIRNQVLKKVFHKNIEEYKMKD